ncbi:DUF6166 domain-containing protein [Halobacterium salinarum]|nr:DUF6166 domain-containing protein [Halobacterium salinarum]QCC44843.1 uncharacterized protein HBSAL_05890 [Halobacterium salinarum]
MSDYRAVLEHPETGDREVLYDGERIEHVPYGDSSQDDFSWGYTGAGPNNVAQSILEHAIAETDESFDVNASSVRSEFAGEFTIPVGKSEEWTLSMEEVKEFLRNH